MENLLQPSELLKADSGERYELLEEKLGITREDVESVGGDLEEAATLLYKSALEKTGNNKHKALGHITSYNLAAVARAEWTHALAAWCSTSKQLSAEYSGVRETRSNGKKLPMMHYLREAAFNNVHGNDKFVHLENMEKSDFFDIEYSNKDLVRGTKTPHSGEPIDNLGSFLMGVYYAIASPTTDDRLQLSTSKIRQEFVLNQVSSCVEKVFNLVPSSNNVKKQRLSGDDICSYNEKYVDIGSKAHMQFLANYFQFGENGDKYTKKNEIPPSLFEDSFYSVTVDERIEHFLGGVVNSVFNAQKSNNNGARRLSVKSNSFGFLNSVSELFNYIGIEAPVKTYAHSYSINLYERNIRELESMTPAVVNEYPSIFTTNKGMFVNPYLVDRLNSL